MDYLKILLRFCFLSIALYLFTFSHVFSQNLVKNPGFETGDFFPYWSLWTNLDSSSVTIDSTDKYEGEFCAKLKGTKVYLFQPVFLEPNTTYKISATYKTESGDPTYFGISNLWGNTGKSIIFHNTTYQSDSISFTTEGNPGNNTRIYFWKEEGNGGVWVDNIAIIADTTGQIPEENGGLGNYYVSSFGDDGNTGTSPDAAWQSIEKVNQINFQPGDQILFEGGQTFIGNIRFNKNDSGTAENNVSLGSYGTGRAIIDAEKGSGFIASYCEYINIKNLDFTGLGRNDGNIGDGLAFYYCSNVTIDSIEVSGFQHSGVTAKYVGNNYQITNTYAHNNGYSGIYISGNYKSSMTDIYIAHCKAENNAGDPTVLNNHSGNGIFAYNASNITIEYSSASNNGWDMPRLGNGPGGIWVAEVDSAVIQHCISHNNKTPTGAKDGVGFDLDGGTTNSIIQYCLSYNNQGAGYGIFQYVGASEWKNNTIRYCISENDGNISAGGNIEIWNGNEVNFVFERLEFYNNVIYNANSPAVSFINHNNSDFNFRNNIFISGSGKVYDSINGENFQGNNWYSLSNNSVQDSVDFLAWAQTNNQEMLNDEIVGIYSNPRFINPGNSKLTDPLLLTTVNDYIVEEVSIVIDAGLDLDSIFNIDPGNRDYFGNSIKQGLAFDMGIFEYINKQEIILTSGWNIISFNVVPNDTNLMSILQPLIDSETLKKVMDEKGNSIEDLGDFGGWQNIIGNLKKTKGYNVNMVSDSDLTVEGNSLPLPLIIPLTMGWNIISWPSKTEQDGIDVFQSLINEGKLIKVMDDTFNSIEDGGPPFNWINNIGNLKPGKGYKVKVSSDCSITVN